MQQAYQTIRIVSEAQTIRVGLSTEPDELMLRELCTVCASLSGGASEGVKAVVLDFSRGGHPSKGEASKDAINRVPTVVEQAYGAIRGVGQPVLAVVRDTLSVAACRLLPAADFTLVAEDARLIIPGKGEDGQENWINGANADRLHYVTWSAADGDMNREMERVLNMLREKSAVALRFAKASTRIGQSERHTPLEALQRINSLYLEELMRTRDAGEGLRAFLEKRKPRWSDA
jgi:enoyl-CoA hydratase/carnithine racemase